MHGRGTGREFQSSLLCVQRYGTSRAFSAGSCAVVRVSDMRTVLSSQGRHSDEYR